MQIGPGCHHIMTEQKEGRAVSYKWQRVTGGLGSKLSAVESFERQEAGLPAEASSSKLLVHGFRFMCGATSLEKKEEFSHLHILISHLTFIIL